MLVRIWINWNPHKLLVKIKIVHSLSKLLLEKGAGRKKARERNHHSGSPTIKLTFIHIHPSLFLCVLMEDFLSTAYLHLCFRSHSLLLPQTPQLCSLF